jgi:hypothetical protein
MIFTLTNVDKVADLVFKYNLEDVGVTMGKWLFLQSFHSFTEIEINSDIVL